MKFWQRFLEFYVNASIHVAFGVLALTQVTILTFDIHGDEHLAWFIFFGTIACYNFIKYGVEAKKYIIVATPYQKNIQIVSYIAIVLGLYHGYFLSTYVWTGILLLLFLTGLYAVPVLPRAKNLRNLGGLKIFIVALVWAGTTVVLPFVNINYTITWDVWVETFQRFLFVLILLVPFEIRDLKFDDPALKTLPQRFGVANTKVIGAFMVIVFFFATMLKDTVSTGEICMKGVLFLGLGALMYVTKRHQSKYFASFWVEGIPILWWGGLCLLDLVV
ncbi:UbiA prenyltransferase family protein [Maribacter thermophilus]|uniref:hypothetical protein n=1 Tax=Maribacter thermophilus TaxID=1197874 RepID=UPI0006416A8B|nr:hypothetical protein [Maribacter thermophilus]